MRWFSVDTPSPYQEMQSFAAKASKFSHTANSKHNVFWSPGACRATPFGHQNVHSLDDLDHQTTTK